MKIGSRKLGVAVALATVLAACGVVETVIEGDCAMRPVEAGAADLRIGPQRLAATSCPRRVEVDGRRYDVGVGRWLEEDLLVLEEYGPITRSNAPVANPTAYALEGVDPREFLLMEAGPNDVDDIGRLGPYMVLWHGSPYRELCRYADPEHAQVRRNAGPS